MSYYEVIKIMCAMFLPVLVEKYIWCKFVWSKDIVAKVIEDGNGYEDVISTEKYESKNIMLNQVAIVLKRLDKPSILCGGSLISIQYVLTAAHCLDGVQHGEIIFNLDSDYQLDFTIQVENSHFIIHPNWQSKRVLNDIALIKISKTLPYMYTDFHPILLPSNCKFKIPRKGSVVGWEKIISNTRSQLVLSRHPVKIIKNKKCKVDFGLFVQTTNICTIGEGWRNGCHGFSGSPLIMDGIQVGLVSFGMKRCEDGYPTVHTKVCRYMDWIRENSNVVNYNETDIF